MDEKLESSLDMLAERFEAELYKYGVDTYLIVYPEQLVEVCKTLHDEFNFDMLSDLTAVDYWPAQEPRFHVVYHFFSISNDIIIQKI